MDGSMFFWPAKTEIANVFVGVFLERVEHGIHVGFLYRKEDSDTYALHLWGHRRLRHHPPLHGQLCVLCKIDPVRLPAISAFARRVYRKNRDNGIPYAFSTPEQDWFSTDGNLLLGPERLGLTCANFVLALYRAVGLPLVQLETWPTRKDDAVWQQSVLDEWVPQANPKTQEHFAQVKKQIGTVRCRPMEIGGAALSSELPCDFGTVVKFAKEVETALFCQAL